MELKIKISFKGYWFIGSGQEAGAYADSLMLKSSEGLPYIPGKTIKGIFKDVAMLAQNNGLISNVNELFGVEGSTITGKHFLPNEKIGEADFSEMSTSGVLCFSNAQLPLSDKEMLTGAKKFLYKTIQNTKIDPYTGSAADGSLRSTEVCIPLNLFACVSYDEALLKERTTLTDFEDKFKLLCSLITEIGGKRRRGFGKCVVEVI